SQIDGFEQHRSSVGAAVVLVKPRDQGLPEKLGKQQTLCRAIVGQTGASFVRERSLSKPFLARWSSRSVHFFTNSPGSPLAAAPPPSGARGNSPASLRPAPKPLSAPSVAFTVPRDDCARRAEVCPVTGTRARPA